MAGDLAGHGEAGRRRPHQDHRRLQLQRQKAQGAQICTPLNFLHLPSRCYPVLAESLLVKDSAGTSFLDDVLEGGTSLSSVLMAIIVSDQFEALSPGWDQCGTCPNISLRI